MRPGGALVGTAWPEMVSMSPATVVQVDRCARNGTDPI